MSKEDSDKQIKSILFVINPVSSNLDKGGLKSRISDYCARHRIRYDFFFTTDKDDTGQIKEKLKNFVTDIIVAAGGDGTIFELLPLLTELGIPLGIIPVGSANGLATELDIPKNLDLSLDTIRKQNIRIIDLLKVNDIYCAHICDIGFNARIVKRFENDSIRGLRGYARHFWEVLRTTKPARYKIEENDTVRIKKAHMVILTNMHKYGTGAVVNPRADINDGKFELVLIRYHSFWNIIQIFFSLFTNRIHHMHNVELTSHRSITVYNLNKENVNIDGEIIGRPEKLEIRNLHRALKVIIPE
ncbi:MAG: diacylglycerol/lipid kinase family protein [Bacteroidota bacterium]